MEIMASAVRLIGDESGKVALVGYGGGFFTKNTEVLQEPTSPLIINQGNFARPSIGDERLVGDGIEKCRDILDDNDLRNPNKVIVVLGSEPPDGDDRSDGLEKATQAKRYGITIIVGAVGSADANIFDVSDYWASISSSEKYFFWGQDWTSVSTDLGKMMAPSLCLPVRTLTLPTYASHPTLKDFVPIYIGNVDQGIKANLGSKFVRLASNTEVNLSASSKVTKVFISPRRQDRYTEGDQGFNGNTLWGRDAYKLSIEDGNLKMKVPSVNPIFDGTEYAIDFTVAAWWSQMSIEDVRVIIDIDGDGRRIEQFVITVVPLLSRGETTDFICQPGSRYFPEHFEDYLPKSAENIQTSRSSSVLSSNDFSGLHPEEKEWVDSRIQKIAPLIQDRVQTIGRELTDGEARIKVAVAHSGGGKRSMLHSTGVSSKLHSLGIYDLSTWIAGLSGGGWHVLQWYSEMADNTQMTSPETALQQFRAGIHKTLFTEIFEANRIFQLDRSLKEITKTMAKILFDTLSKTFPIALNAIIEWIYGKLDPLFDNAPDQGPLTESIMCLGELKLQSRLLPNVQNTASLAEYWGLANARQWMDVPLGTTLSGLVDRSLLQNHLGPLPLFQLYENPGSGRQKVGGRNWEITPFDFGVQKGDLHVSFPTKYLGTREAIGVTNLDQLSFVSQMTSFAFGGLSKNEQDPEMKGFLWNDNLNKVICGLGDTHVCSSIPVQNPFYWNPKVQDDTELFQKKEVFFTDGGLHDNIPTWAFVTSRRKADILIAVDNSAEGFKQQEPAGYAPISSDTTYPGSSVTLIGADTCSADDEFLERRKGFCDACTLCGHHGCSTFSYNLGYYLFGCSPDADYKNNELWKMVDYDPDYPNTLPKMPTQRSPELVKKVTFFGCDTVSTKTAVVYDPMRIVTSGQAGVQTLKGSISFRISSDNYTPETVTGTIDNGKATLPENFDKCFNCLLYAVGKRDDYFMRSDPECRPCYKQYCYEPYEAPRPREECRKVNPSLPSPLKIWNFPPETPGVGEWRMEVGTLNPDEKFTYLIESGNVRREGQCWIQVRKFTGDVVEGWVQTGYSPPPQPGDNSQTLPCGVSCFDAPGRVSYVTCCGGDEPCSFFECKQWKTGAEDTKLRTKPCESSPPVADGDVSAGQQFGIDRSRGLFPSKCETKPDQYCWAYAKTLAAEGWLSYKKLDNPGAPRTSCATAPGTVFMECCSNRTPPETCRCTQTPAPTPSPTPSPAPSPQEGDKRWYFSCPSDTCGTSCQIINQKGFIALETCADFMCASDFGYPYTPGRFEFARHFCCPPDCTAPGCIVSDHPPPNFCTSYQDVGKYDWCMGQGALNPDACRQGGSAFCQYRTQAICP